MRLALLILLSLGAAADDGCLQVDRASVTAGDLAISIPEFRAAPASRHLFWAPAPGLTRTFSPTEMQDISTREGVKMLSPVAVCVTRRTVILSRDQVVESLRERLPAGASMQLIDYCRTPVIPGRLRFEPRPTTPPNARSRQIRWKGEVVGDDGRTMPVWATAQVQIDRQVVRAARPIPINTILTAEDLIEQPEPAACCEPGPSASLTALVGSQASRSFAPGQVVSSRTVRKPPMVSKGQTVRVMVQSGRAVLGLDAIALGGGNRGDSLQVRNHDSGRSFTAKVVGPGTVLVQTENSRP